LSAARVATAILFGLLAIACLELAGQPAIANLEPLANAALFTSLAMLASSFAVAAMRDGSAIEPLGLGKSSLGPLRFFALVVGAVGLSHLVGLLLQTVGLEVALSSEVSRGFSGGAWADRALLVAAFCVAPGVCEEILFRGLIQRSISRAHRPTRAVLFSSLLFGAAHLDITQGIAAVLLGLYLGAVAHQAGSVRPCIACHIANNAAVLAWSGVNGWAPDSLVLTVSAAAASVGVAALATSGRAAGAQLPRSGSAQPPE
jgi:membrane protease YdiL (CAAX protease family)